MQMASCHHVDSVFHLQTTADHGAHVVSEPMSVETEKADEQLSPKDKEVQIDEARLSEVEKQPKPVEDLDTCTNSELLDGVVVT